ncbi:hypothetical protein YC2023_012205 [Brassica napus]
MFMIFITPFSVSSFLLLIITSSIEFQTEIHTIFIIDPCIAFSCLVTGVTTDSIKDAVDWPRPNFFYRCFPDGKPKFDPETRMLYHGVKKIIKEGYKSFPSGHTSWSFAGLTFLACYLSGKIKVFDRRGHVAKLCLVFLPILVAVLIGISRVDDYWHHWTDVFAGTIIGTFWSSHDNDTRSGSRVMLDEDVEPGSTYFPHDFITLFNVHDGGNWQLKRPVEVNRTQSPKVIHMGSVFHFSISADSSTFFEPTVMLELVENLTMSKGTN